MTTVTTQPRSKEGAGAETRLRTIGSVCEELRGAFPDISVSKIRYLEDQGLIAPRRTRGGYRLFSPEDVERLATILRLQRDEFLPLRVIREELAGPGASADRARRRSTGLGGQEPEIDLAELCERASVAPDFVRQLEEYGIVHSRVEGGEHVYWESDADIAAACARLARFGVDARHLRAFVTAAARQAGLVEQLVAPGLRSRSPERRKSALEDLEALARVAEDLSQLLLLRDLRAVVERSS
jgi:DNA-binding transcriptional MerR regulator